MLDDALRANSVKTVLDDRVSSLSAGEGCATARSRRAPSHAMLDDIVSPKSAREDAGWYPVRDPLWLGALDDIPKRISRDSTRAQVAKSRPGRCLTTSRHQLHHRIRLDDHMLHMHSTGRCLTAERRQAPMERVLSDAMSSKYGAADAG